MWRAGHTRSELREVISRTGSHANKHFSESRGISVAVNQSIKFSLSVGVVLQQLNIQRTADHTRQTSRH